MTEFGSVMSTIRNCTVTKCTSSINSGVWKNVNVDNIMGDLLRSTIPQAYVDITYDFFEYPSYRCINNTKFKR